MIPSRLKLSRLKNSLLQLGQAVLYDWTLAGQRVRLWKPVGESYEHVLMKALAYTMYVREYPDLRIEHPVGLRYKPDLVSRDEHGRFRFWGECGTIAIRKIKWLLKHARVERLVIFKIYGAPAFAQDLRAELEPRYRTPHRVTIINFTPEIIEHATTPDIAEVPPEWYTRIGI
ncbi:MAG: YaeQ family protein [Pyrinomonadaceae bacterium MAG19_C2-C3]|nr:YaeQ family protein [Pyrinomonadaceae bacterium MAG19_C2-C3]